MSDDVGTVGISEHAQVMIFPLLAGGCVAIQVLVMAK